MGKPCEICLKPLEKPKKNRQPRELIFKKMRNPKSMCAVKAFRCVELARLARHLLAGCTASHVSNWHGRFGHSQALCAWHGPACFKFAARQSTAQIPEPPLTQYNVPPAERGIGVRHPIGPFKRKIRALGGIYGICAFFGMFDSLLQF